MSSDETLVTKAANGCSAAFDELVRRHYNRVERLAWIMTRGKLDIDDIVQETFIRVFRALGTFRGDSSFGTWVQRIAVNVSKSHIASRRRRLETVSLDSSVSDGPMLLHATNDGFEDAVIRRQMIDRAIAGLSVDARRVLVLRDVHDLAYQEIATMLCVPMGTVESRVFRARRQLRPILAPLMRSGPSSPVQRTGRKPS